MNLNEWYWVRLLIIAGDSILTCSMLRFMYDSGKLENCLVRSPTLLRN